MGHHLKTNVLEGMPAEFASLVQQSNATEGHDMMSAPDLDRHVFMHVLDDRGAVELDPEGCALYRSRVSSPAIIDPPMQGVADIPAGTSRCRRMVRAVQGLAPVASGCLAAHVL